MTLEASLGLSKMTKTTPKNFSLRFYVSISLIYSSVSFSSYLASSMLIGAFSHHFPGTFLFGKPLGYFFSSHSALYLSSLQSGSLSSSESFSFSVFLDSIQYSTRAISLFNSLNLADTSQKAPISYAALMYWILEPKFHLLSKTSLISARIASQLPLSSKSVPMAMTQQSAGVRDLALSSSAIAKSFFLMRPNAMNE